MKKIFTLKCDVQKALVADNKWGDSSKRNVPQLKI